MDHYPNTNINEREMLSSAASSRHDSASSVAQDAAAHQRHSSMGPPDNATARTYNSFPSPLRQSPDRSVQRTDSSSSTLSSCQRIDEEYARYTDAPPPYSEKQYEGKSEDQQNQMRVTDYSREISRMMGRQLVTGLKSDEMEKGNKGGKST